APVVDLGRSRPAPGPASHRRGHGAEGAGERAVTELLRRLLNLPAGASTYALAVDHLHFAVIGVTMAGSMAALGVAVFFAFRYQRRASDGPTPEVKAPLWLELGWGTGLFALFLAFWVIGFAIYMRIEVPPAGAMDVYVTGKQWMWKFE